MSIKTNILNTLDDVMAEAHGIIPEEVKHKLAQVGAAIQRHMPDLPQVSPDQWYGLEHDALAAIMPPYVHTYRGQTQMPIVRVEGIVSAQTGYDYRPRLGLRFYGKNTSRFQVEPHRTIVMPPRLWRYAMALLQEQLALVEQEPIQ